MTSRSALIPEENLTLEDAFTMRVYERQEPLQRSTDEMEPCYSPAASSAEKAGHSLHLRTPVDDGHRKLGAISFGSRQVDTYSPDEVGFVSQVADHIALAFDDALNFAALRRATEELQSKNDRLQLLLEVTNQQVSKFELSRSAAAISQERPAGMQCDLVGGRLADAEDKQLRMHGVDFPEGKGILREEDLLYSIEGSPSGAAYRTMKPRLFRALSPISSITQ